MAYTLQLLHFADGEAGLLAADTAPYMAALVDAFEDQYVNSLTLAGGDNFIPGPFLAAGTDISVRDELNFLTGSTITSTTLPFAAVDIAIHNIIGVEASTIGNHEFDLGSTVFQQSFTPGGGWVGAAFPYLSANLDFSGDSALAPRFTNTLDGAGAPLTTLVAEADSLNGRIAPSVVITEGGEKIGLVGATTQILESISSPSGTEVKGFPGGPGPNGEADNMALLAAQLQPVINELIAEGVTKIILMAHLQVLANEIALASLLTGVDIILSAGSNTRLGDSTDTAVAFPGHAATFAGDYPLAVTGADGKPTLIVNTDNEYTYLGRLVVEFDDAGDIMLDSLDIAINGAYAATASNVAAAWGVSEADLELTALADGTRGGDVQTLTSAVADVIAAKDGNVAGFTNVYLEGERIAVRNQETNFGNLSADANAAALREALGAGADDAFVVSLKNGGGIRAQIGTISTPDPITGEVDRLPPPANPDVGKPEGGVSQLDIENALRFNNTLMAFDTTPAGLKAILEHGVAVLGNQGRFPQLGGVRFSYDPDLPAGARIANVSLIDENGFVIARIVENGMVLADAPALITMVTLGFLAQGGDGYPMKANGENFRFVLNDGTLSAPVNEALNFTDALVVPATALGEQQAFFDYMNARHGTPETAFNEADTPASQDVRIENLNVREDAVFLGETILGDDDDDVLVGTAGDDELFGGRGRDNLQAGDGDDLLDGGRDKDTMAGGAGDDTYVVDTSSDRVIEGVNDGVDTVLTSADFTLGANVENAIVTSARGREIKGNELANTIIGGVGDDELKGAGGDDILDGGAGRDELSGGSGDDLYIVDNRRDEINESRNGGYDTVQASVSYRLDDHVEKLILTGAAAINGHGNSRDNWIIGNDAANTLSGGGGDDTLTGGAGADTFIIERSDDLVVVTDFNAAEDKLDLSDFHYRSLAQVLNGATQVGDDVILDLRRGGEVVLQDTELSAITADALIL